MPSSASHVLRAKLTGRMTRQRVLAVFLDGYCVPYDTARSCVEISIQWCSPPCHFRAGIKKKEA